MYRRRFSCVLQHIYEVIVHKYYRTMRTIVTMSGPETPLDSRLVLPCFQSFGRGISKSAEPASQFSSVWDSDFNKINFHMVCWIRARHSKTIKQTLLSDTFYYVNPTYVFFFRPLSFSLCSEGSCSFQWKLLSVLLVFVSEVFARDLFLEISIYPSSRTRCVRKRQDK